MNARILRHDERGFTLIEVMIVTMILGILLTAYMMVLPFLESKARDGRRYDSLDQMHRVIELYYAENNTYPSSLAGAGAFYTFMTDNDAFTASLSNAQVTSNYIPNIVPNLYESLPTDPKPGSSTVPGCQALGYKRAFIYFSDGDHYKIVSQCASETNDYSPENAFYDPGRPTWGWAASNDMDYTTFVLGW